MKKRVQSWWRLVKGSVLFYYKTLQRWDHWYHACSFIVPQIEEGGKTRLDGDIFASRLHIRAVVCWLFRKPVNLLQKTVGYRLTFIQFSDLCFLSIHAILLELGCVHAYFAKAESAFWNADSKRRSKTPLIQAIVRAQVNRKGVYMTSFKRGYNVILRSCFHQNQRFALTTIVNAHFWAAFMLILRRRFETLIQNADPKRRSRKYCSCFPREEDDTFTEEGMSRNSRNV